MIDMKGGDLDGNAFFHDSSSVGPKFSSGRCPARAKFRTGHARRISYVSGGRNEAVRARPLGRALFIWR